MRRATIISLLVLVVFAIGCVQQIKQPPPQPYIDKEIDSEILAFVYKQNFPDPLSVRAVLTIPEQNTTIFEFAYGEMQDCPFMCFQPTEKGIRHNNKIGLITDNYIFNDTALLYNFDSNDTYLFSEEFFDRFNDTDSWLFKNRFLPLVARDPDTPGETLSELAAKYYWLRDEIAEDRKIKTNLIG